MEPNNPANGVKPSEEQSASSGMGPFVGAIIIIILLAAGAFYFWSFKSDAVDDNPPPLILGNETAESTPSSDAASGLPPQQESDSPESIESDLKAMNFNQFDAQIDSDLQGFQQSAQ